MKKADVNIQTLARVQKVTAEGVEYMDKNGQTILAQVDLVVVSTGQRTAGDDLAEGLEADAITVKRAGDAVAMGNIRVNVRSGFHAGYDV
jgi:NADH dehydrogenase FAD-containing subunit